MTRLRDKERGEGKIGCVVSLLVLVLGVAVGAKVVPVYYSNDSLATAAEDIAQKGGVAPVAELQTELRNKARELNIPEALADGAITVTTTGEGNGSCTIVFNYARIVDLYGAYTLTIDTQKTITKSYMDAR